MRTGLRLAIERDALETFGVENQKMKLVEECGELLTAIARERCSRSCPQDVITELADVSILIEQLAIAYGPNAFEEEKDRKLSRLDMRIAAIKKSGGNNRIPLT